MTSVIRVRLGVQLEFRPDRGCQRQFKFNGRVRPRAHFEIDVGSGLIRVLDGFGRHRSRLVTGVRANFAARVSHTGDVQRLRVTVENAV